MAVAGIRRSVSFSNNPNRPSKPKKTYHVRSTSLPCRPHPLFISHLKDAIHALKTWASEPETRTSSWICDGLTRLRTVHESLDDILSLPQTHDSLRRHPVFAEKLLEDVLRYVDVFGIFQTSILILKQQISAAQMAVRRKDGSDVALHVKGLKKTAKEMKKLVSTVQSIGNHSIYSVSNADTELSEIIRDVNEVTVSVSVALFGGISSSLTSRKSSSFLGFKFLKESKKVKVEEGIQEFQQVGLDNLWGLRKKGSEEAKMALKRMHDLEDCVAEIESGSERVFRSLINTRVSLLNVLTQ